MGERCRHEAGVIELGDLTAGVAHGRRHVEGNHHVGVGFRLEGFDVDAIGAGEDAPVHLSHVVPRRVLAVLGEVRRDAEVNGFVQAADETVHHRAGDEIQVVDPREHVGIEKLRRRGAPGRAAAGGCRACAHGDSVGVGTASSSWSIS